MLTVKRTVQRVAQTNSRNGAPKTLLMIGTPKSLRSHRVLSIPGFLFQILEQLAAEHHTSEFIFGIASRAAEPRTVQRQFKRWMSKLGIEGAHFHMLRHSFATRMLE